MPHDSVGGHVNDVNCETVAYNPARSSDPRAMHKKQCFQDQSIPQIFNFVIELINLRVPLHPDAASLIKQGVLLQRVGLKSSDIMIRVSNRKVLQEIMKNYGVPDEKFSEVCVVVDKLDKLPREEIVKELSGLGVAADAIEGLLAAMAIRSIDDLTTLLGNDNSAVQELARLLELARGYGYADWLEVDVSVVRGLAYYTGVLQ